MVVVIAEHAVVDGGIGRAFEHVFPASLRGVACKGDEVAADGDKFEEDEARGAGPVVSDGGPQHFAGAWRQLV